MPFKRESRLKRNVRKGSFRYLGPSFNNNNLANGIWSHTSPMKSLDFLLGFIICIVGALIALSFFIAYYFLFYFIQLIFGSIIAGSNILMLSVGIIISVMVFFFVSGWYIYYEIVFKNGISPRFETNVKSVKMKLIYLDEVIRAVLIRMNLTYSRRGPFSMLSNRILYFIPDLGLYIDIADRSYKGVKVFPISVGPVNDKNGKIAFELMKNLSENSSVQLIKYLGLLLPHFSTDIDDELYLVNEQDFQYYSIGSLPPRISKNMKLYSQKEYGQGERGLRVNILFIIAIITFVLAGLYGVYALIFITSFDIVILSMTIICFICFIAFSTIFIKSIRKYGIMGKKSTGKRDLDNNN